jgi:hypothetical protein
MKRSTRILTLAAAFFVGLILYAGVMFAMAMVRDGMVSVRIQDHNDGVTFEFPLPGVVVEAGAALAPLVIPDEELREMRAEIGQWGELVLAMAEELEEMPDDALVDVHDGGEHVRVIKDGGDLRVIVDSDDVDVDVTVPARAMRRSLEHILG